MLKDFTVFNSVFAPFSMKTSKNCQEEPDQEISQPRIWLTLNPLTYKVVNNCVRIVFILERNAKYNPNHMKGTFVVHLSASVLRCFVLRYIFILMCYNLVNLLPNLFTDVS